MLDEIDRVEYHDVFCEQNRLVELFLEMRVADAKKTATEDRSSMANRIRLAHEDPLNQGALEVGLRASALEAAEDDRLHALESQRMATAMRESEKVSNLTHLLGGNATAAPFGMHRR